MHDPSDFRSDTVTRPTPAMRDAMANAVVGDDVLGDDPTIHALEEKFADLMGKEAGLYVPSGSMGNLIAVSVHTKPGAAVLMEEWGHSFNFEAGGLARFGGVMTRTLSSDRGVLDPAYVDGWLHPGNLHMPRAATLVVENTHNFHGGRVVPLARMRELREITAAKEVALHIDGARIWNACAATGQEPSAFAACADSITACLSKGLSAPVGSVLAGTRDFVEAGRAVRKTLGGGMRQAGILAAAGIVALDEMRGRLVDDHGRAKRLAEGLSAMDSWEIDPASVETNILFVKRSDGNAAAARDALEEKGVLCLATAPDTIRLLTHNDVDDEDVDRLLEAAAGI
ncbi:MAG: threonine aldolase family protein [Planctomycetota bacterium]|jgi:threonine aldolase